MIKHALHNLKHKESWPLASKATVLETLWLWMRLCWEIAMHPITPVVCSLWQLKNCTTLINVVVISQWSVTQQEWMPLHLSDLEPIHIPSIRERAECLISRFKGKTDRPPKVILMHGLACCFLSLKPHVLWRLISSFNMSFFFSLEPKKKPSQFFIEQWKLSCGPTEGPSSKPSSHDFPKKVKELRTDPPPKKLLTYNVLGLHHNYLFWDKGETSASSIYFPFLTESSVFPAGGCSASAVWQSCALICA